MTQRWKQRPEGSNWGDFGPDDRLGRVNWITAEKVKQGIAEVRDGRSFCLSLPLEYPGGNLLNPRRFPPQLFAVVREGRPNMALPLSFYDPRITDVSSDDAALLYLQYSTQWDSFAHIGSMFDADGDGQPERVFYNGWRGGSDVPDVQDRGVGEPRLERFPSQGSEALGIHNFARHGMQGRGVLVNLWDVCGEARTWIGYDQLMRAMETQEVAVEKGDMLCFYTGFGDVILSMKGKPDLHRLENSCAVLDGRDKALLKWIDDSGVSCLIADNYAVEGLPAKPVDGNHASLPLHEHCLFKLGIPLGELWYLSELAAYLKEQKRSRFLLTAPPLRLTGAVGSPVSPIATV
ncbi:cyclase family protein [uncultured Ferrovibrio sp.]|jgi:kynurenine formamidase|uniref:cyclase family protein n=1 Tax=uncultured Ferrovibrio sp. TaxID=1576913 RepID=UPI00261D048C|nr:cyclase family protein [uncultured Ferrovibrio sp.]